MRRVMKHTFRRKSVFLKGEKVLSHKRGFVRQKKKVRSEDTGDLEHVGWKVTAHS